MSSTFRILFYLRKNHLNKNGKVAIMIRITVNGDRSSFSSKLEIEPEQWDTKLGKVIGKSNYALKMNTILDDMRRNLTNIYHEIDRTESHVDSEKVRNVFLGYTMKHQSLLNLFSEHNEDVRKLVGVSKTKATLEKYQRTYNRLEDFMKIRYNISDISLKEINYKFITDFETYLRADCRCNENTTAKFMQFFKRIIIIARNNGWIVGDPFANYKIRIKRVDRGY